jgi:UDP-N-acetylglucosamine 2-epimerase (non-hydrolysing)
MEILTVVGARPNMMKVAPLLEAFKQHANLHARLVHTGQHYDAAMSDVFFAEFGLPPPDAHLGIGSGTHTEQTARTMLAFEPVLRDLRPDLVLVVGDVNATIACALVAAKRGVALAHVEAGLRSFDWTMPEEINRVLTDRLADYCFTPSADADAHLRDEGIPAARVFCVGNIMADSLLRFRAIALRHDAPQRFGLVPGEYAVLTLHRPSNVDEQPVLAGLVAALVAIQQQLPIAFPVHPRTRERLQRFGLWELLAAQPGMRLLEPLGYLDTIGLLAEARLALTDSGGVQEETTLLGVPCLTLRANTERPVTVTVGTNRVIGNEPQRVVAEVGRIVMGDRPTGDIPPLWDGHTAERIAAILAGGSR